MAMARSVAIMSVTVSFLSRSQGIAFPFERPDQTVVGQRRKRKVA